MKTEIRHMSVNIQGLLNLYKRKSLAGIVEDDNGKPMGDLQARQMLAEHLALGHKILPTGDCEGFDPFGKGCPGHKTA